MSSIERSDRQPDSQGCPSDNINLIGFFRVFVIFKKVACVHCMAKKRCPNAIAMGLA
jgi:hypothetical protein